MQGLSGGRGFGQVRVGEVQPEWCPTAHQVHSALLTVRGCHQWGATGGVLHSGGQVGGVAMQEGPREWGR